MRRCRGVVKTEDYSCRHGDRARVFDDCHATDRASGWNLIVYSGAAVLAFIAVSAAVVSTIPERGGP